MSQQYKAQSGLPDYGVQSLQGVSAEGRALLLKAWRWHEIQLRINTAAPSSTLISTEWWADYEELIGPNVPITCGFQV